MRKKIERYDTDFGKSATSCVREETGKRESSYKDSTSIQYLPTYHILKIHFNIILPSAPRSTQWSSYHRVPNQTSMHLASPHTCYMTGTFHFLDLITRVILVRSTDH